MVLTDEELIERHQSTEDRAAAGAHANELLRRYSERVVKWCWRFSNDREAALDLAQEVLLKAYRNLPAFRAESKFSTWLYLIARNHCLNYVRGRVSQPVLTAGSLEVDPQDAHDADVLKKLELQSDIEELRKLMAKTLNETESKVMMLHFGEEVPLEAITRLLGLENQSGAKAFIVSAKRKLSAAISRRRSRE
ncbi:MAG: sigma-70 family RNA polymerase sigma factor [Acidobacteria bacterium]|nr:sigma-70 family RNA polymerase sigma factor [Acidobacteriota bacterium]